LAEKLIKQYNLTNKSRILDIGCGKGYLLYELKKLLPGCIVCGMDVSEYAIKKSKEYDGKFLIVTKDLYIGDDYDLIVSVNSLHNMKIKDLSHALWCMEKHGVNKYIVVESFRNEKELCNLQCWALTCQAWFSPEEWIYVMNHSGYSGDYEFIYFE
jgi:2-polyprenyl-3-methyl-5-hydroxy-6-metoxy-1,4-benzoquinol methylase